MIFGTLVGTTLVLAVATDPTNDPPNQANLTLQQKAAATQPLVRSATECIVHAIVADPRYGREPGKVGDLIVASMPTCLTPVRAMIDAYDLYYGQGAGEAFFMGPYLDVLPRAVSDAAQHAR